MKSIRQVREQNLIALTKHINTEDALMLQRISHRLHQLDEHHCNWGLTECQDKRLGRLERQAQDIAAKYNLVAYHLSDPRGWSLYLVSPKVDIDTHYNEGLGICPH